MLRNIGLGHKKPTLIQEGSCLVTIATINLIKTLWFNCNKSDKSEEKQICHHNTNDEKNITI